MKKYLLLFCLLLICTFSFAQLPAIILKSTQGITVKTDTLYSTTHPTIISFFATWCKPCNRELSAIAEVYEEWQSETSVQVIPISIDQAQNVQKVAPLVAENEWPYELVLLDENKEFSRALGIQMIPFVLIIDTKGQIVYKHNGYTDGAEEDLINILRELTY